MIDQKQLEDVEYFRYFGSMRTNCARCTREIESSIALAKSSIRQEENFTSKMHLNLRKKFLKWRILSIEFYGAETWSLWKVDQKYWVVLKCGAGERLRGSVGPIV
jgi:hypothetical protein